MTRRWRRMVGLPGALALTAIVLLAAGLWGPVHRYLDGWRAAQRFEERRAAAEAEREAARREFAQDRVAILARIRDLQAAEDQSSALRLATRYRFLGDADVEALYQRSVSIQGERIRLAQARGVVALLCKADAVQTYVDGLFTLDAAGGPRAVTSDVRAVRLDTDADVGLVRRRIQSDAPGLDVSEQDPQRSASEPHDHRIRLDPVTAAAILDASNDARPYVCLWNVEGTRTRDGRPPVRFAMTLWLAPRPGSRMLAAEPLAYRELPGGS